MRKGETRLRLNRETLRELSEREMRGVDGGISGTNCQNTTDPLHGCTSYFPSCLCVPL